MNELIECDMCKGTGVKILDCENLRLWEFCKKCKGTRKLNWLEIIFGKSHISDEEYFERKEFFKNKRYIWK